MLSFSSTTFLNGARLTDITSSRVIKFLQSVFVCEGYPIHIVTDNSVQFTSHEIKDYFNERGIEHSTTALYHPQGNGLVERMDCTIKEGIQLATLQHKTPSNLQKTDFSCIIPLRIL